VALGKPAATKGENRFILLFRQGDLLLFFKEMMQGHVYAQNIINISGFCKIDWPLC